jgi:YD repeat-containing protein
VFFFQTWQSFCVFCNVKVHLLLVFLLPLLHFGQMLDNREGNAFTDKPFFSPEFIRLNKIKSLTGIYTYKKPGETMRNTQFKQVYQFDTLGRLVSSYETRKDDGTKDTTWHIYKYSRDGKIIEHKKGDGKGFTVTNYDYDANGRIIKEYYARDYKDTFNVSHRTVLNTESMRYEVGDSMLRKTIYNSYDLPYMHVYSYFSTIGYLKERQERLIMTTGVTTYKYAYNERGLLSSIKFFRQDEATPYEEQIFLYDPHGNLTEKQYYRGGKYITETEMIYNEKSKLLTYVLTRDVATNYITILGFKDYRFY